jgi:hypothetical protein
MESLTVVLEQETEMTTTKKTKPRKGALQVSMGDREQHLCHILSELSGSSAAGMINSILEPYLDFVIRIVKEDGYIDEYGIFAIDPIKVREIYEKNSKGTSKYLSIIEEYKNKQLLALREKVESLSDDNDAEFLAKMKDNRIIPKALNWDFVSPSKLF